MFILYPFNHPIVLPYWPFILSLYRARLLALPATSGFSPLVIRWRGAYRRAVLKPQL